MQTLQKSRVAPQQKTQRSKSNGFSYYLKLLFSTELPRETLKLMWSLHRDVVFCSLFNTLGAWK